MKRKEFISREITGTHKLIMRYYKAETKLKGIIVFVHGVSHGAWCWEYFIDYFTKIGYACFAINLRGHGDNDEKNIKGACLSDYVIDVIRCIDYIENHYSDPEINITYFKPIIIGHSMGGAIVEKYISDFSHKVSSAILFAPVTACGMGKSIFTTTFTITGANTIPTTGGHKTNKHLAESNFFVAKDKDTKKFVQRITDETKLKYYDKQLCKESLTAMLDLYKFKLSTPNISIFVIGSDKDAYFPIESLNKTANFYDTTPMILKGLCHDMMLDPEWKKAAESVLEFIENPNELKQNPEKFIDKLQKKIYPNKIQ